MYVWYERYASMLLVASMLIAVIQLECTIIGYIPL